MAATMTIAVRAKLEDLGVPIELIEKFSTVPTEAHYQYVIQTTTDVSQALSLGGVSTVQAIIILAKSNDLGIDTSYDTTYHKEITVAEGQFAVLNPAGTVYVMNSTGGEVCTFEYIVIGS
jgi:hypothetical protein